MGHRQEAMGDQPLVDGAEVSLPDEVVRGEVEVSIQPLLDVREREVRHGGAFIGEPRRIPLACARLSVRSLSHLFSLSL